jgi:hypothetical protein
MKRQPIRIWLMATLTPVFLAIIVRLIWEVVVNPSPDGFIMTALVILVLLGFYALILYLVLRPNRKLVKSLPVGIGVALMATGGLVGGVIHLVRFIPSPQSGLPWSLVIALLYLLAGLSAYSMLLWVIWSTWRGEKRQE